MQTTALSPVVAIEGQETLADTGTPAPAGHLLHLPLDAIRLGDNTRKVADENDLRLLAHSIRNHGLLQPILVEPTDEPDQYLLTAGERRFTAARMAGLQTIPAYVRGDISDTPGSRMAKQLIENGVRHDIDPVDEAHAIAELMRSTGVDENGVAELLSISRDRVKGRLELLQLPEDVKAEVTAGTISLANARTLAAISARAPRLASAITERVVDGSLSGKDLDSDPATAIRTIADDETPQEGVFVLPFTGGIDVLNLADVRARVASVADALPEKDKEQVNEHLKKLDEALTKLDGVQPVIEVDVTDQDRARAAHCLLEYRRDRYTTTGFLQDPVLAADWAAAKAEALADGKIDTASQPGVKEDDDDEDVRSQRELRKEEMTVARADNDHLAKGVRAFDAQGGVSLNQATVLAALILDRFGVEIANGLRITRPEWFTRDLKVLRGGGTRSIEAYPEPNAAKELLESLLERATTGPELLGRVFGGIMAAALADENALPAAQRRGFALPYTQGRENTVIGKAPAALWAEAEQFLPERIHEARKDHFVPEQTSEPVRDRLARRG